MKLAKTTEQEIDTLKHILLELDNLQNVLDDDADMQDIRSIVREDPDYFKISMQYIDVCHTVQSFYHIMIKTLTGVHYQRILWNCSTLLSNCADPDLKYLDFHPDIKKGLEMLEQIEDAKKKTCPVWKYYH